MSARNFEAIEKVGKAYNTGAKVLGPIIGGLAIKKGVKKIPGATKAIAKAARPSSVVKGIKKAAKIAKTVAGTAKGGAAFVGRIANPANRAKFYANAARGKGFVFPGSKYIGPGNEMNKGDPTSQADANAYQHDVDYDEYLKKGVSKKDVYTGFSDADERLLKNTKADTAEGFAVNVGMGLKKLGNKLGLTKRIRDKDVYGNAGPPKQGARPGANGPVVPTQKRAITAPPKINPLNSVGNIGNPLKSTVQTRP